LDTHVIRLIYMWSDNAFQSRLGFHNGEMGGDKPCIEEGLLEYKSRVYPTLIKFKGLSMYMKFVSYSSYCQLVLGWNLI